MRRSFGRLTAGSLRTRLLVAALAWVIVAVPLGGVALALGFRGVLAERFDEQLGSLLLSLIASVQVTPEGEIAVERPFPDPRFQKVYSGWYWAIGHEGGTILRSRSLWDLPFDLKPAAVSATPRLRTLRDTRGAELRVAEQTVALPGMPLPVTFALAGDLDSVREQARDFNRLLWISLLALGTGLVAAVVAQVSLGLRPLRRAAEDVERIRRGEAQRLRATGLREIDALVEEVNTLVDQDRARLERMRANAADLAHALKTPLAVLRASLADGESREPLEQVDAMQRILSRQLTRAASAGPRRGVRTPVGPVLQALVEGMRRLHAERRLDIEAQAQAKLFFAGDTEDLEEMLGNLLDNACKWARSRVVARGEPHDGRLRLVVDDDGPGMSTEQASAALERGRRFDTATPGSGLGLGITGELASLYDGTLDLGRSPLGGTRATLDLPAG